MTDNTRLAATCTLACACRGCDIDGQQLCPRTICNECCAVNTIALDDEGCAHVVGWVCEHGKTDEEPCDLCEIEVGIAV